MPFLARKTEMQTVLLSVICLLLFMIGLCLSVIIHRQTITEKQIAESCYTGSVSPLKNRRQEIILPSRKKHFQRMAINAKIASMNYDAAADWTLEQIKSTLAYCRQAPERNQDEYFQYLLKLRNAIILLRNFDNYDLEAIMQGNESPEHASQTKEQKLNATFKNLDNLHNMLINLDTKNFSQEISVKIDNFRNNLIALQQDTLNNQITDDERKELARDMHHEYVSEILPAILKSKWGDESINTDCFLVKLLDVSQQYPILQSLQ